MSEKHDKNAFQNEFFTWLLIDRLSNKWCLMYVANCQHLMIQIIKYVFDILTNKNKIGLISRLVFGYASLATKRADQCKQTIQKTKKLCLM